MKGKAQMIEMTFVSTITIKQKMTDNEYKCVTERFHKEGEQLASVMRDKLESILMEEIGDGSAITVTNPTICFEEEAVVND